MPPRERPPIDSLSTARSFTCALPVDSPAWDESKLSAVMLHSDVHTDGIINCAGELTDAAREKDIDHVWQPVQIKVPEACWPFSRFRISPAVIEPFASSLTISCCNTSNAVSPSAGETPGHRSPSGKSGRQICRAYSSACCGLLGRSAATRKSPGRFVCWSLRTPRHPTVRDRHS